MNTLLLQAIKKAGQIRARLKLNMISPINIFDACAEFDVNVRFIDISMEGMYLNTEGALKQTILISSLRPLPRRVYTCGHEFGHHIFGHGTKVDGLTQAKNESFYDKDEYVVDAFAGALLMPVAGVEAEFKKRHLNPQDASSITFYTISSVFGTGYSTLVSHCQANKLISDTKAIRLLKETPAKMLKEVMGKAFDVSHFKIVDGLSDLSVIDLEVGNYLFLPFDMSVEGSQLCKLKNTDYGTIFIVKKPGITRAFTMDRSKHFFIRVQNSGYVGLAENRHLEDKID